MRYWPRVWPPVAIGGVVRSCPDDFLVEELGAPEFGDGEHLLLLIEKRAANTTWVAARLAEAAGCEIAAVGYRGLKDRHALTRQWFSVVTPGNHLPDFHHPSLRVLATGRARRKLRPGGHAGNHFAIRVRHLRGQGAALEARAAELASTGVPNYFAAQRFGRDGVNLRRAARAVARGGRFGRHRGRGFVISAARAMLFNEVLAWRVRQVNWGSRLPGEPEAVPSGPLWGRGRNPAADVSLALEAAALAHRGDWCHALEHVGLRFARRPLVLVPKDLEVRLEGDSAVIEFDLPPGGYAHAVLRELFGCLTSAA